MSFYFQSHTQPHCIITLLSHNGTHQALRLQSIPVILPLHAKYICSRCLQQYAPVTARILKLPMHALS
jgi:hypothetical protein